MIILLKCSLGLLISKSITNLFSQNQREKCVYFFLHLLFYWKILREILFNVLEYSGLKVYRRMAVLPPVSQQKSQLLVIVTGADSGMGRSVVEVAATQMRAKVIFTVQRMANGQSLIDKICKLNTTIVQRTNLIPVMLDLASPDSVRRCAATISTHCTAGSDIRLINNAGVLWTNKNVIKRSDFTSDVDYHFQVNYLGHFLLTSLLMPHLMKARSARVVNVSSVAYLLGYPLFDEAESEDKCPKLNQIYLPPDKPLKQLKAYGRSKLAILLITRLMAEKMIMAAEKLGKPSVQFYAIHPGGTRTAMILSSPLSRVLVRLLGRPTMLSPMMGAQTTLHCAFSKEVASQSGLYYENCRPSLPLLGGSLSKFEADARRLWTLSCELCRIKEEDYYS